MKFGSFFSGIGGLDLGLERAGMKCLWQVENDLVCQEILKRRFPHTVKFGDVRERRIYPQVDLLCGGFPCQPISMLGKQRGTEDERWLWPYFYDGIVQLLPRWVLIENVEALRTHGLDEILTDLACCGYDAEWDRIPASSVGAPHVRFRYFIVAYPSDHPVSAKGKSRRKAEDSTYVAGRGWPEVPRVFRKSESRAYALHAGRGDGDDARTHAESVARLRKGNSVERVESEKSFARFGFWADEPRVVRMVHGFPYRVDRITGLGNAVVPQVAEWVGIRIVRAEEEGTTT